MSILNKLSLAISNTTLKSNPTYKFPEISNPSLILKIISLICGILVALALLNAQDYANWIDLLFSYLLITVPVSIATITTLIGLHKLLPNLSNRLFEWSIYLSSVLYANVIYYYINQEHFLTISQFQQTFTIIKISIVTTTLSSLVVLYLYHIALSLGPSNAEVRLQSLTYRIRPHFLFNSLNAILSLIRRDQKKAEFALEELSELFRWILKDSSKEITINHEIGIVQQFVAIEKLRLGDRLNIIWDIDSKALDAMIPSLTLQPLVENAIYHGVESMAKNCEVKVSIKRSVGIVTIEVSNTFDPTYIRQKGSGTALDTIRQRLELYFDIEFKIENTKLNNLYITRLQFPYREK